MDDQEPESAPKGHAGRVRSFGESLIWEYPRESVLATVIFAEDGGSRPRGGLDRPDLLPASITAHLDRHYSGKRSIALGLHHDLLDQ